MGTTPSGFHTVVDAELCCDSETWAQATCCLLDVPPVQDLQDRDAFLAVWGSLNDRVVVVAGCGEQAMSFGMTTFPYLGTV